MKRKLSCIALSSFIAALLPAQKITVRGDADRQLQVLDLLQTMTPLGGEATPLQATQLGQIAAFARHFATPAFGVGDDVQPMGGRYLAVLGSPQQCGFVEHLLALSRQRAEELLQVEVHLLQVPAADFERHLRPFFAAGPTPDQLQRIVTDQEATPLLATMKAAPDVELLIAPRVCVRSLQHASLSVGDKISYIRDFTVMRNGDQVIANPVIDTVFDGTEMQMLAGFLPDHTVGLECAVQHHVVQRPLLQTQVSLGVGAPVTIQLPRVTSVRLEQRAALALDATLVLAAPRVDGSYLAAMVRICKQP